ncbi:ABC transporter ATP-binding protein [Gemmiger sp. An50]|uniref:ABC transporter ATP-binding protein n=1 Tax=Gemmiger sp. An50 TaxID=1965639 RepID=UPI000B3AFD97|nr:ABC transporter ATP-binding protein [Gemmiger sp. An50]OUN84574.1 ABC transporter [Gemmiger sp. An50]
MEQLKRVFAHLGRYKKEFILAVLFVVLETGLEMFIPVIMADTIDVGVANRDVNYILIKGVQMGVCALLSLVTGMLYARYMARAACGFGAILRQEQYQKIQEYSFSDLDRFETSSLITRMTTDITVLQNAVSGGLRPMVRGPSMLIMGVGLAFFMNARLSLIFLCCVPVLAAVLAFIVYKVAPMYGRLQVAMDRVNVIVEENLTAIRAVKAFVRGEYEEEKFERVNSGLMQTSQRTFHYAVMNLPAFQFTMYAAVTLLLWFGGNMVIAGGMQVGKLTGFLSYVLQIMNSLMMISNVFLMLTRSLASASRVMEVLDHAPSLTDGAEARDKIADGSVEFCHVDFKYSATAQENVLEDICLRIPAGQTLGILGGTGSAKTSLVQLIPRLYDVTGGCVKVGGRDVREYRLEALRDAVGIVLQKNVLFSGTIRENLLWGNEQASDEELDWACRTACADEFLSRMPKGLDTELGQGGVNVSGGQKQRLCIARTLLKRPKVLIFDDSTSAVDTATEARIRAGLAALKDTTKIIIAQRVTSVMEADQILVLEDGRVNGIGTHAQLLAENAIYREIYESQMKGGGEE